MFGTIRISRYSEKVLPAWLKRSIAVAFTIFFSPLIPMVWGGEFDVNKLESALSAPPYVPDESQNLANNFIAHTLPKLISSDDRLAHQLGFGSGVNNPIMIDRAFAMMVIRREDVMSLLDPKGKVQPVDLVNNTNNWFKEGDRLVPKRIVFLMQAHDSTSEGGETWSSVTMEQSAEGSSWRIIQVGAPKLSQAMNKQGRSGEKFFLLWITDLNRHYLGSIQNHLVTLKVLFKDRLLNGDPGDAQPITPEYLAKLKRLYEELDLPKKLRPATETPRTDPNQGPAQAP